MYINIEKVNLWMIFIFMRDSEINQIKRRHVRETTREGGGGREGGRQSVFVSVCLSRSFFLSLNLSLSLVCVFLFWFCVFVLIRSRPAGECVRVGFD